MILGSLIVILELAVLSKLLPVNCIPLPIFLLLSFIVGCNSLELASVGQIRPNAISSLLFRFGIGKFYIATLGSAKRFKQEYLTSVGISN